MSELSVIKSELWDKKSQLRLFFS